MLVLKQLNDMQVLERYAVSARQYRGAAASKDHAGAEQHAADVAKLYRELKSRGRESQDKLLGLLDHDDPAILRWAAEHALEFAPGQAKPVLERLAKKGAGVLSVDAQSVLRLWHKTKPGMLK